MSKTLKRSASMFMALVMILAMVPVMSVTANAAAYTGNCDALSQGTPTGATTDSMAMYMDKPLYVAISETYFNGADFTIGEANGKTGTLSLSSKKIAGTLRGIENFIGITSLDLSGNFLTGSLPVGMEDMDAVTTLNLSNNYLSGAFPEAVRGMAALNILNVNNNAITTLPSWITELSAEYLIISNNSFAGQKLPADLGNMTQLVQFSAVRCGLVGQILDSVGSLSNLVNLQLYGNKLTGAVPSGLGSLPKLDVLYLHENQLTGKLPIFLTSRTYKELFFSDNNFEGTVQADIKVTTLLVSHNPKLIAVKPAGVTTFQGGHCANVTDINRLSTTVKLPNGEWMKLNWDVTGDGVPDLNLVNTETDQVPNRNIDVNGDGKADLAINNNFNRAAAVYETNASGGSTGTFLGWMPSHFVVTSHPITASDVQMGAAPYYLVATNASAPKIAENKVEIVLPDGSTTIAYPPNVIVPVEVEVNKVKQYQMSTLMATAFLT